MFVGMASTKKIGRNDPCPCGSGNKFKKCCDGKVNWIEVRQRGASECIRHLSARGKNLLFLQETAAALQLDTFEPNFINLKRAITPKAVQRIFESIVNLWPDGDDLERILKSEASNTSGLYVGTYEPNVIFQGVTRHSLYSDTIILVDPFLYPLKIREQYNPLFHPEKYRTTALKCLKVWFSMAPWIQAGIVKFVRLPGDFNAALSWDSMQIQKARREKYPELREIGKREVEQRVKAAKDHQEYRILMQPDDALRLNYLKLYPNAPSGDVEKFLAEIQHRRKLHPFYLDPIKLDGKMVGELLIEHSGAAYDMAKRTALLTGSYLITDLEYRWKEIELDRSEAKIDSAKWTPFAKAFQEVDIKYLENVPLEAALRLREQGRLDEMRSFLRKVWRSTGAIDSFDDSNAENLASELREKVREAEDEWAKIDRELLKWFGGIGALGAIATGQVGWIPSAISTVIGGAVSLGVAQHQRIAFGKKFPAGFFLKLKK